MLSYSDRLFQNVLKHYGSTLPRQSSVFVMLCRLSSTRTACDPQKKREIAVFKHVTQYADKASTSYSVTIGTSSMADKNVSVGGTSGGLGEFLTGLLLMMVGFYMIFTNTIVYTSFWGFRGHSLIGPLIILFMVGLVFLFVDGQSWIGRLVCGGSVLAMVVGIVMNLRFHFKGMTLLSALIMFGLPAVGFGLIIRSLKTHGTGS